MSRAGNNRTASQHKVAPAPPQIPVASVVLSENGKIGWPSGSIPRRVKKLSWDDETSTPSTPKVK